MYSNVNCLLTNFLITELNPGPPTHTVIDQSIHLIGDSMVADLKEEFSPAFNNRVNATAMRGADVGRVTSRVKELRIHK